MQCENVKESSGLHPDQRDIRIFPFNSPEYAETYGGVIKYSESILSAVFVEKITGTEFYDGRLPWPYVSFPEHGTALLGKEFPELVTVAGVVAPSRQCPSKTASSAGLVPFKQHFIFDPCAGSIRLSKKSALNLKKGSRVWRVADADTSAGWEAFAALYETFISEKKLTGGFYDFRDDHFFRLPHIRAIKLFGVRSSSEWGAMACGARHGNELHLMHICIARQGYKSCASYVLMDAITRYCAANDWTLFVGGMRHGADEGLLRFKKRWTNKTLQAWFLKIIIRPDVYARLAIPGNPYFPGYRHPYDGPVISTGGRVIHAFTHSGL
ncbi:MAG: hypothetical protein K4571_20565 [Deltaproteobacteria bacterium]